MARNTRRAPAPTPGEEPLQPAIDLHLPPPAYRHRQHRRSRLPDQNSNARPEACQLARRRPRALGKH